MAPRKNSSKWFVRLDVDHASNPKMLGIDPLARLLYIDALCYSSQWQTDGLVPARWIDSQADGRAHAEDLAGRGLFDRDGDDYTIHDYAEHQITTDDRIALSRAGQAGNAARWAREKNTVDKPENTDRIRIGSGTYREGEGEGEKEKEKYEKRLSVLPSKTSPSAKEVLEGWNRIFGKSYTVKAWGGKLTACIRAHPDVTLADHLEMIEREHAAPWWTHDRPETPALQYGTVAQFERCIQRETSPRISPGDRAVQQLRAQRAQSERNGNGNV